MLYKTEFSRKAGVYSLDARLSRIYEGTRLLADKMFMRGSADLSGTNLVDRFGGMENAVKLPGAFAPRLRAKTLAGGWGGGKPGGKSALSALEFHKPAARL
ncbi:hypothetical protein K0M31_001326 [Melipona bicolor]|uniref:Uncharacterized protein n=1 Tax=Melipona bicolor TaxID=60889 RepID=A0AA40KXM2_9HYME|nr:hypothetical protein K0M31_001326 [Melipona bicolor]